MRNNTERPITITEGTNQLVGQRVDDIINGARRALAGDVPRRCPALWDGCAGGRIAEVIVAIDASLRRPTTR